MSKQSLKTIIAALIITMCVSKPATVNAQVPLKTMTIILDETAFQYFNDNLNKWVVEPGKFDILVGNSSRDIKLTGTVIL